MEKEDKLVIVTAKSCGMEDKVIGKEEALEYLVALRDNNIGEWDDMLKDVYNFINQPALSSDVEEAFSKICRSTSTETMDVLNAPIYDTIKQALELGQQYKLDARIERGLREEAQSKLNSIEEYIKVALRDVLEAKEYALKTKNETKYKELQARQLTLGEVNQMLRSDENE